MSEHEIAWEPQKCSICSTINFSYLFDLSHSSIFFFLSYKIFVCADRLIVMNGYNPLFLNEWIEYKTKAIKNFLLIKHTERQRKVSAT